MDDKVMVIANKNTAHDGNKKKNWRQGGKRNQGRDKLTTLKLG
jgi:hypothetical protein